MSPAIFPRKWLDKTQSFFATRVAPGPGNSARYDTMQWMCTLCVEGVAHIVAFFEQAHEIVLANPEYTPKPSSDAEYTVIAKNWRSDFGSQAQELGLQKSDFPDDAAPMTIAQISCHEATTHTANVFTMESRIGLAVHW